MLLQGRPFGDVRRFGLEFWVIGHGLYDCGDKTRMVFRRLKQGLLAPGPFVEADFLTLYQQARAVKRGALCPFCGRWPRKDNAHARSNSTRYQSRAMAHRPGFLVAGRGMSDDGGLIWRSTVPLEGGFAWAGEKVGPSAARALFSSLAASTSTSLAPIGA